MMWHTHAAMGASAVWFLLPILPPGDPSILAVLMAFAVAGALVPDLDAVESKVKHVRIIGIKPLVPLARTINRDFGHRGLLHSLRGWMIWAFFLLTLSAWTGWLPVVALSLGYASHLVGDACTRTGIPFLYPKPERWFLSPAWLRVTAGSADEELFFVASALGAIILLLEHLPF